MRFAVLGDVHGNKYALESVFKDIEKQSIDFVVSTGDLIGYMPFVNEVIRMMKDKKVLVVQGNHDQVIGEGKQVLDGEIQNLSYKEIQKDASRIFTNWAITEENREYLKNLPKNLQLECNNKKLVVVHGSPRSIEEYLYGLDEILEPIAVGTEYDAVVCGHTHIPYAKTVKGTEFINAGSVGKPKHGDNRATYVIIEVIEEKIKTEVRYVTYDVDAMIAAIKENQMISEELIEMIS